MPGSATDDVATSFTACGSIGIMVVPNPTLSSAGHRDVEHGVDLFLALPGRDLADGEAFVALLQLQRIRRVAARSSSP